MTVELKPHKLFISHSSKDKEYMGALVEMLEGVGIPAESIICTSVPGHGIPGGVNIFDWLRDQFLTCDLRIIFALSRNYYDSAACLNEMGAAWVTKTTDTLLLLPGFDYSDIGGCIDPRRIGISFNTDDKELKYRLEEFKKTLVAEHLIPDVSPGKWDQLQNAFIRTVREIAAKKEKAAEITEYHSDGIHISASETSNEDRNMHIDEQSSQSLEYDTEAQLKRLISQRNIDGFVEKYSSILKKFYRSEYDSRQQYLNDFKAMLPYRNMFLNVLDENVAGKTIALIFEELYNTLCSIHTFDPERNHCSSDELDIFLLHIWELFVLTTTYYLKKRLLTELRDLLVHSYYLKESMLSDTKKAYNYTVFNYSSSKMDRWVAEELKPGNGGNYYSVSAYLLCNRREYGKLYTKRAIAEADLVLFQILRGLDLNGLKGSKKWFPRCYIYADYENALWSRLGSRNYCESIMPLFGVTDINGLKQAVKSCGYESETGYNNGFADPAPQITDYIRLDDIGTLP